MASLPTDPISLDLLHALVDRRKKTPRAPQTAAQVAARSPKAGDKAAVAAALDALATQGHVVRTAGARGARYAAAPDLTAALSALAPPPAPKRAPRASTGGDLAALEERLLAAILPRLDRIERALGLGAAAPPPAADPARQATPLSDESLLALVHEAGAQGGHGALVPIGRVRALASERLGVDRDAFDRELVALERRFGIDLKIADDPRRPDAHEGIEQPGRGLLFFAVDRRQ